MALRPLNVLSLCAGVGSLDLGLRLATDGRTRTVCYVEREAFCVATLVRQMEAGRLDSAPVWGDLATFDARAWRGVVDCVVAGFPCQPFSDAGQRLGTDDERWLWPDIERIVRECEPGVVFAENVPGLVGRGLRPVLSSLAELGFDAEWGVLSAAAVGAPHIRKRLWLLAAHPERVGVWAEQGRGESRGAGATEPRDDGPARNLADPDDRRQPRERSRGLLDGERPPQRDDADGCGWWDAEPDVGRVAHGVADRVDRLRAIGNGVVPLAAAHAFRTLARRLAIENSYSSP